MKCLRSMAMVAGVAAMLTASACIHIGRANAFQKVTSPSEYEQQMWEQVKAARWDEVNAHMAETFQASMPNGARTRAEMLDFLRSMKLAGYTITALKSSPNGADMVLTYDIELHGTIAGQPIPPGRIRVLTVWQSVKRGWIQVAQSFQPEGHWPEGGTRLFPQ